MKDDLHDLIDGELPDEQAAEVLHLLSVDPEKRSAFRQQMNLQRGLFRNERFKSLSSLEEGEMLDRVMRTAGETSSRTGRLARRGAIMLALGFLIGSGAGYVGHALVDDTSTAAAPTPDTVRMVDRAPTVEALSFNRDSVVAAITDSLRKQSRPSVASTTKKSTPRVARRSTRPTATDDLTGRPQVKRNRNR
ncbi:MAG: hypothetical protein H7X80_08180 [bacterium]|nr:hypothetical protein [Candidatus Kapabacteria bacterium]